MRVLVMAGSQSAVIKSFVESKALQEGIEIITASYLEDIESLLARGESFDKAVILEHAYTYDLGLTKAGEIRENLESFARMAEQGQILDVEYIFVASTKELADIVSEETVALGARGAVVKPLRTDYSVQFFITLFQKCIAALPSSYVYDYMSENGLAERMVEQVPSLEGADLGSTVDKLVGDDKEVGSFEGVEELEIGEELSDIEAYVETVEVSDASEVEGLGDSGILQDGEQLSEFELGDFDEVGFGDKSEDFGIGNQEEKLDNLEFNDLDLSDFDMNIVSGSEGDAIESIETSSDGFDDNFQGDLELDVPESLESESSLPISDEVELEAVAPVVTQTLEDELSSLNIDTSLLDGVEVEGDLEDDEEPAEVLVREEQSLGLGGDLGVNFASEVTETLDVIDNLYSDDNVESFQPVKKSRESGLLLGARKKRRENSGNEVHSLLNPFAKSTTSFMVTGSSGSGKTTVAYNLANTLARLGYSTLIVDLDIKGRGQNFVNLDNYNANSYDSEVLPLAFNQGVRTGVLKAVIPRVNLRLLSLGLAKEVESIEKLLSREGLLTFSGAVKSDFEFVIYDCPFDIATSYCKDLTVNADKIIHVVEMSHSGLGKYVMDMGNIDNEAVQDLFYSRSQVIFNRVPLKMPKLYFGQKISSPEDVLQSIDKLTKNIIGSDIYVGLTDLEIVGLISQNQQIEDSWFSKKAVTDSDDGLNFFLEIIIKILTD